MVASLWILFSGHGEVWAVLLVLVSPGYVLVAALFPSQGLTARLRKLEEDGEELRATADARGIDLRAYASARARAKALAKEGRISGALRVLEAETERLRDTLAARTSTPSSRRSESEAPAVRGEPGTWAIDWAERIGLSVGLSIAIVALLGLVLAVTPWGLQTPGLVVLVLAFTLGAGGGAYVRRLRVPVEDRLSITVANPRPPGEEHTALDKALVFALGASLCIAGGVFVYVAISPRPIERFTQFYLLDRDGTANRSLYPTTLNTSTAGTVIQVVTNNESTTLSYAIHVDLVGLRVVLNATTGLNQTLEVNRSTVATFNLTLAPGQTWRQPYTFLITVPGLWKLDFLLFRSGDFSRPYREVTMDVRVDAAT